jgi:hypothetical protein
LIWPNPRLPTKKSRLLPRFIIIIRRLTFHLLNILHHRLINFITLINNRVIIILLSSRIFRTVITSERLKPSRNSPIRPTNYSVTTVSLKSPTTSTGPDVSKSVDYWGLDLLR